MNVYRPQHPPRLLAQPGALEAARTRRNVAALLEDSLGVLRYLKGRWVPRRGPGAHERDPTRYVHHWRALADDCGTVIEWLLELRLAAQDEAARLESLNGETPDDPTRTAPVRPRR